MIAIIDYGMGNVRSVYNALDYLGEDAIITAEPDEIDNASHLILPGVGSFSDAMASLEARGLVEVLVRQVHENGKPFLGICLGLQLLARSSQEHGTHRGLGWIDGEVVRLDPGPDRLKIPHVGWNDVLPCTEHPLFARLPAGCMDFYFTHSFHLRCHRQHNIAAECEHGRRFTAAVHQDNIFATQFHPEKSQDNGLTLLENFVKWDGQ